MSETNVNLPALIDRAQRCLADARSSAEVLEARAAAQAALHYAKLVKAANETQADCLMMIARAEIRMADEIDAAQARGEVAGHGGARNFNVAKSNVEVPTLRQIGIERPNLHEWRQLRDAGGEGLVESVVADVLSEGRARRKSAARWRDRTCMFLMSKTRTSSRRHSRS